MKKREPTSPPSSPVCQTNSIERFGLTFIDLNRLGDLEHAHRARAVVVGAVVDRVEARARIAASACCPC